MSAARSCLTAVREATAQLLDGLAGSLGENWHQDRAAVQELVEQIMALDESSAEYPAGGSPERRMNLRTAKSLQARTPPPSTLGWLTQLPSPSLCSGSPALALKLSTYSG
jgi:hypothetical protein